MGDEAVSKRGVRVTLVGFAIVCTVVIATTLIALSTPSGSEWAKNFPETFSVSHNVAQSNNHEYSQHAREHWEWSQGMIKEHIDWSLENIEKYTEQERSYWENRYKHLFEQPEN